jgi:hypothetical protein
MYFGEDCGSTSEVLELAWRVCEAVPGYELEFLPDGSFWSLLDD